MIIRKWVTGISLSIAIAFPVNAADFFSFDIDSLGEIIEDVANDYEIDIDIPDKSDIEGLLENADSAIHDVVIDYMTEEEYGNLKKQMRESLNEFIKDYAGSFTIPEGLILPEEDFEGLYELLCEILQQEQEGNTEGSSAFHNGDLVQVSDENEFFDMICQAKKEMVDILYFETVDGFTLDYDENVFWERLYVEVINRDPVVGAGSGFLYEEFCNDENQYIWRFYYDDKEELARMRRESQNITTDIANELLLSCQDDFSKVNAVNNFLCGSVYYPYSEPYSMTEHMVYGATVDNCAVCEGYAGAAKAILDKMGVDCMVETGTCINGEGHAWNLVKVDGNWYQMDVTWNDADEAWYQNMYFLVTDEYMRESRSWDYDYFPKTPEEPYFLY